MYTERVDIVTMSLPWWDITPAQSPPAMQLVRPVAKITWVTVLAAWWDIIKPGATITASYASSRADGGVGNNDHVGGLVGLNLGHNHGELCHRQS